MACRQLIQFPAIYRDGQLLTCATDVFIDCSTTKINGEKTEKAWDAVNEKFMRVTGFFINYKGIEYGSIDVDQDAYFALCVAACGDEFRLHADEYDYEFE